MDSPIEPAAEPKSAENEQRFAGKVALITGASDRGIGGEIAATIAEEAFEWLDAPVVRVASIDTPVPYSPPLEEYFLPNKEKVLHAARQLAKY